MRNNRYGTVLFIGNTDERLIHWIHSRFGGTIGIRKAHSKAPRKPTWKPLWWVNFSGASLEPVLTAALPYLVLKREQAELMLEFRKTVNGVGHNENTPDSVLQKRADIKARMTSLNIRGVRS